jgi:hypothetical protein
VLFAFRYFRVVRVVPTVFIGGFVLAIILAAIQVTTDPSAAVFALNPVLKLHLFASSSGFQLPARRGYYDLLLTSSTARWQIGVAHCGASMMPGVVSWLCVAVVEGIATHGAHAGAAEAAGTCMAFLAWSVIAWAVAVFSSRTTATIAWLVIMSIPGVGRLSPLAWLGVNGSAMGPLALCGTYALAAAAFATALLVVGRGNTPLEGSQ